MKPIEELKAELVVAQAHVRDLKNQIEKISDGYTYHIRIRSYGSVSWRKAINTYLVERLCADYGSGDDGFVDVFTDNPKILADYHHQNIDAQDWGCCTVYNLDELPENRREVSKSQGIMNFIIKT